MELVSVWLINHKASLDELSPMNEDGSAFMVGTGIVAANNMKEAISLFEEWLKDQKMEVLEYSKCEEFNPTSFNSTGDNAINLKRAAEATLEDLNIRYIGISSEAFQTKLQP